MLIKTMAVGYLLANCYIVTDEKTLDCAVIDPGGDSAEILDYIEANHLHCRAVLLTHGHMDHCLGLEGLLAGLKNFHEMGRMGKTLAEMDLVAAMDAVDGGSWEAFLTDWVFNVGDYANQMIDWFE